MSHLAVIMLSAASAGNDSGERICFLLHTTVGMLFSSAGELFLYCVLGVYIDNRLMRSLCMVLRENTVIFQRPLRQMVLTVGFL